MAGINTDINLINFYLCSFKNFILTIMTSDIWPLISILNIAQGGAGVNNMLLFSQYL